MRKLTRRRPRPAARTCSAVNDIRSVARNLAQAKSIWYPVIGHNVSDKLEIDGVSLQNIGVTLLELFLNVTRSHSVEAKVLQDENKM